jgi:hypothetical protein
MVLLITVINKGDSRTVIGNESHYHVALSGIVTSLADHN